METVFFAERRLNKARIEHLTRLATNSGLFKVCTNVKDATVLLAQDSTGDEIVDFLAKNKKLTREVIIENRKLVDISWFVRCMKEKRVIDIKPHDKLVCKGNIKKTGSTEDVELPIKKPCLSSDGVASTVAMYACQRSAPLGHFNKRFTDALEVLEQHAHYRGDQNAEARALAFRRGSASLKSFTKEVTCANDLKNMPYVGLSNSSKAGHCKKVIMEILTEGLSDEVESVFNGKFFQVMKLFCGIFGVGPNTARKWFYDLGLRKLDDLKANNISLTQDQTLGLEHYDDLNTPVTIDEAQHILKLVQETSTEIRDGLTVTLVGGFRRGKSSGHDVDLLISHPENGKENGVLPLIIARLEENFIYTEKKMSSMQNIKSEQRISTSTMDHFEKCFSILRFKYNWMNETRKREDRDWKAVRVDLIVVPHDQFAFALLGWTGTKHFEREIRRYARTEKQMVLTSHGMYSVNYKQSFPAATEKEIFNLLEIEYRTPSERCC